MANLNMLSTIDNPFNPWTEYDEWLAFDEEKGYNSNALLARVAISSDDLSESVQNYAREQAIDEIVETNTSGVFIKVPEPVKVS